MKKDVMIFLKNKVFSHCDKSLVRVESPKCVKEAFGIFARVFAFLLVFQSFAFAYDFYWEEPRPLTNVESRFPKVISSKTESMVFFQEVDSSSKKIFIDYVEDDSEKAVRFAGPFLYSGEVPDIYNGALNNDGTLVIAALSSNEEISVFVRKKGFSEIKKVTLTNDSENVVGPRVFSTSKGEFIIFAASGTTENFSLLYSVSSDGENWSTFDKFKPAVGFQNAFSPYLLPLENGNDLLVFQTQVMSGTRFSYQIYSSLSTDGLKSWSQPKLVTGSESSLNTAFTNYHNQRPYLYEYNGAVYIAFERTHYTSENARIWVEKLNPDGSVSDDVLEKAVELNSSGNAHRPILFDFKGTLFCVWFDNRSGNDTIYIAEKNGFYWSDSKLIKKSTGETFVFPLVKENADSSLFELSFIWQQAFKNKKTSPKLYVLETDRTCPKPELKADNFKAGKKSSSSFAKVRVNLKEDSSGIAGYSWIFTNDENEEVPKILRNLPDVKTLRGEANSDGKWYFKVRATDYAGNWSDESSICFERDTVPPEKPHIEELEYDEKGFLKSNTFSLNWNEAGEDDISGYTWSVSYLGKDTGDAAFEKYKLKKLSNPPRYNLGNKTSFHFDNYRNGCYAFSVCAIDEAGNISDPETVYFKMNKYKPSTKIDAVNGKTDDMGVTSVSILGSGFNEDLEISKIYISKDGKNIERELSLKNGDFKVSTDERIQNIRIEELDEGSYKIGLYHPKRGTTWTKNILNIQQTGNVKIETEYIFEPDWHPIIVTGKEKRKVDNWKILMALILSFTAIAFAATFRSLLVVAKENRRIQSEVMALLEGGALTMDKLSNENKKQLKAFKAKGTSLKVKIASFTIALILLSVVMVAIPLSFMMTRTQEKTLAENLLDKVSMVLESMSTGVRAYLPAENILELSYLPNHSKSLSEVKYATITGISSGGKQINPDFVWATNDDAINEKIDTKEIMFGESRISGDEISSIIEKCVKVNEEAQNQVMDIVQDIVRLNEEGQALASKTDEKSLARLYETNDESRELSAKMTSIFDELSDLSSGSIPAFNSEHLDRENTKFIFYKPVLFRQGNDTNFVRSVIFMEVSTLELINSVKAAQRNILIVAVIVAVVAILLGIIGSLIISSIIVLPLQELTKHVAFIGETKNKERLAGHEIQVKSKDEIGMLGETVNDMTRELVKAALDEKLLMDGKVVQQTFLPLGTDELGNKMSTGSLNEKNLQIFGYYEGASGVSGDYFDYMKLDNRRYAIIKCDASGHGVPAALIMTIVAVLFRKFFNAYKFEKDGTNLTSLVTQINDFIESLGLKGKFAALMICLLDTESDTVYMCNAGDNVIHFYDQVAKKEKVVTLTETPAAGPLPSFMVEMKGGFVVEKMTLKKGDTLFLYTDGIEEATRKFRDSSFQIVREGENADIESEQLEGDRINAIIEAVFQKSTFTLEKKHNPIPGEKLVFDFSNCEGTLEEAIMALASVEKVFRFYKEPNASGLDVVKVDRKIDAFLKTHFNLYDFYCSDQTDSNDPSYIFYNRLKEDEQLDDLTLLAVRKI